MYMYVCAHIFYVCLSHTCLIAHVVPLAAGSLLVSQLLPFLHHSLVQIFCRREQHIIDMNGYNNQSMVSEDDCDDGDENDGL